MYLAEFIKKLRESKAKITGSYADGSATFNSDYDFFVPENRWKEVVSLFREADPQFESVICGHIATRKFQVLIEASMLFKHRKNRLPKVKIEGIEFPTY